MQRQKQLSTKNNNAKEHKQFMKKTNMDKNHVQTSSVVKPNTSTKSTGPSRKQLNAGLPKGESVRKTFFSNGEYVRVYTNWNIVPEGLGHVFWWCEAHNRLVLKGQKPVAYKKTSEGAYMGLFTIEQTYKS